MPKLPIDKRSVDAAHHALEAHHGFLSLEAGNDGETRVWHLLLSLLNYCEQNHIDFDAVLAHVRSEEAVCRGAPQ